MPYGDAMRERTHEWSDPEETAAAVRRMDGMSFLKAMMSGEIPPAPISHTLGFALTEAEPGRAVFELQPTEFHYNPIGSVHGGVYATLLDSACGCAVHTTLALGEGYTAVDLTTKFLRTITVDTGPLRCEGTLVHRGRRMALAEARLTDADGRLYAHATTSCMIFPAANTPATPS